MLRPLSEAIKGDKIVLIPRSVTARRELAGVKFKIGTVERVNPKSISAFGKRWDKKTGLEVNDPGYGDATRVELWDPSWHPFREDAAAARNAMYAIINRVPLCSPEKLAKALPMILALQRDLAAQ